jgi:hypothetical protein
VPWLSSHETLDVSEAIRVKASAGDEIIIVAVALQNGLSVSVITTVKLPAVIPVTVIGFVDVFALTIPKTDVEPLSKTS